MVLGVINWLFNFSRRVLSFLLVPVISSVGSWPPTQCQRWVASHAVGLKSNQTLVGCFHKLISSLCEHNLQADRHCISKVMQLWCLTFSFGSMQNTFLYHKHQSVRGKALCRHQLSLPMFTESYRCLQKQSLTICLWRATLATAWWFGSFCGAPLTNSLINCKSFLKLEVSFGEDKQSVVEKPIFH